MNTVPLVSVWMVTFNHQEYIAQAVESVMMQKTDFTVHLFIGEDFSSDNTKDTCQSLKNKYPDQISLVLNDKNLGPNKNAKNIYEACFNSGAKYIAMLEGDDYWTDPLKLQKQVDFMEGNPDYGICFHNVRQENDFNSKKHLIPGIKKDTDFTLNDYVLNNKTATCSIVFKNDVFETDIPKWFSKLPFGDLGLILMVLKKYQGKGRVLKEEMAVYRIHGEGVHGSFHKNNKGLIKAYKQHLLFTKIIEENLLFETEYKNILYKKKIDTYERLSVLNKQDNNHFKFLRYKLLSIYTRIISKLNFF